MAYLTFKVDWALLLETLKNTRFLLYAASSLFALSACLITAVKYHILLSETSLNRSILSLTEINFISRLYSLFIPSGLGPSIVRWFKITNNKQGRIFFTAATLFERLTYLFMLILLGAVPLFIGSSSEKLNQMRPSLWPKLTILLIIIIIAILYFIIPAFQYIAQKFTRKLIPSKLKRKNWVDLFFQQFSLHRKPLSLFLKMTSVSIWWHVFYVIRLYLIIKATYLPLSFIDIAWMGPLVLLLQALPISFSGIGVREGAYAYLVTLFGIAPEKGVLIGILAFSQTIIMACIGVIFELRSKSDIKKGSYSKIACNNSTK
jgi:uncharacterized membrane protein YbhN (UPF0104 family)